jgi:hypothetical protein
MSPCGTLALAGAPRELAEVFDYLRQEGIPRRFCRERHMGSRAIVIAYRVDPRP